ncbi:MAG TPA: hypothetical protein VD948_04780, partial [Rhodothermales bacterium]|nr:hypothetical protein [Rhodothermales bacterium]
WDVGIQSGPEDDVRLVPWMASMGPDATAFDLGLDHPTSGGVDDPQTDAVYWMRPSDTTPGQAGYTRAAAEMQRLGASYTGAGIREEVLAHTVLVCWNCGRAGTGPFLATRPEPGTVFRIETSAAVTSPPVPAAPADGASTNAQPVLYWHEPPGTDRRYVEVARDADFTDIVVRDTASSAGAYNVTAPIVAGWTYYWRVRVHANGAFGADSEWSTTARFTAGVSTSTDHTAMHPAVLTLDVPRPHPVRGTAAVRLGVPASGPLRVRLYDLLGREVARLHDGDKPAGWTTLPLDVSGLTSSLYVLRAEMDGQAVTRSVVVAR